ncbi:MAG: winged helix-turn-helix domain-containing protein [Acidobacteriota bacterium]|nr:winged helix-turn-helix domain-containing protein [Acidobacteriota bacterium]
MQPGNGTPQDAAPRRGSGRGTASRLSRRLRFGDFEFDPQTLELHNDRETIRLQPQPARLLHLLLASRGAVVSREAVRRHLWTDEIHVEFDQSMNSCVKRIRAALGDSAEAPRYIETLPRIGYRFLQPVIEVPDSDPPLQAPRPAPPAPKPLPRSRRVAAAVLAAVGAAVGIILTVLVWHSLDSRPGTADEPPRHVLAILPFAALENSTGAEPFRQALAQELITSLARHGSQNLAVVAQNAGPDVETGVSVPGVHADFVLDGRVQREQGRLRVWARLLLAKDGTVLWTEAYDGAEEEILVFQTEVSTRIGDAVLGRLAQLVEESPAPHRQS